MAWGHMAGGDGAAVVTASATMDGTVWPQRRRPWTHWRPPHRLSHGGRGSFPARQAHVHEHAHQPWSARTRTGDGSSTSKRGRAEKTFFRERSAACQWRIYSLLSSMINIIFVLLRCGDDG